MAFAVQWRGRSLKIRINQEEQSLEATQESGEPMTLSVRGQSHDLRDGHPVRVSFRDPSPPSA
jgi:trehalose/maltose hydrolase-like predicted phosphorylase